MIVGLSLPSLTTLHVIISLTGIGAGAVVLYGILNSKNVEGWTALFLVTTILTSATGFLFPFRHVMPSHVIGLISLAALAAAVLAFYRYRLQGAWRLIYVVCASLALYLNAFVGVVQAFQKIPLLQPLAPTQSEAPFVIAQLVVLAAFLVLGYLAIKRFHPPIQAPV